MRRRLVPLAVIGLVLAVLVLGLTYQRDNPREIVGTGSVTVAGVRAGSKTLTLRTRDVRIAGAVFKEVEMPGGTWIACTGDCARAAREAGDEFWDAQQKQRR